MVAAWYRSTFGFAVVSAVLMWAALPPLDLWPLAWIAPVWWVLLIRRQEFVALPEPTWRMKPWLLFVAATVLFVAEMGLMALCHQDGYRTLWVADLVFWPVALALLVAAVRTFNRSPYVVLWLVGLSFWLATIHWLRLPHWATCVGWLTMSAYFACYLPLFVGLSRVAVHRLRIPVIVAAPVVWTGLELARAHVLTGMTMASLGHTQYRWIGIIQVSDLGGAFAVSFLVMFVAACLARMVPLEGRRWAAWPMAAAGAMVAAAVGYGQWRMSGQYAQPGPRVALIQGAVDTQMRTASEHRETIYRQYLQLSIEARKKYKNLDFMVWPETMFPETLVTYDSDAVPPAEYADWTTAEFHQALEQAAERSRELMAQTVRRLGTPMVLGVDRQHYSAQGIRYTNAAVALDAAGEMQGRYEKMHLVMFGEYVPYAHIYPWLQKFTPLSVSVSPGPSPEILRQGPYRLAPDVCYESVLSHVIRGQVLGLREKNEPPDLLVNLTNDGWFWGSSELDMHFVCGVFRAVECRKPLVSAANTGISAWIDGDGRVLGRGPKHATATLLAEVQLDNRQSWYLDHGDWLAGLCLAACLCLAVIGVTFRPKVATTEGTADGR